MHDKYDSIVLLLLILVYCGAIILAEVNYQVEEVDQVINDTHHHHHWHDNYNVHTTQT